MGFDAERRAFVALGALTLASGCQEGVEVVVTQTPDSVVFTVDPANKSFDACVRSAYVYAGGSDSTQEVWSAIDGRVRGSCVKAITYGIAPTGFSGGNGAPALETGKQYRVALLGAGFNESTVFRRR